MVILLHKYTSFIVIQGPQILPSDTIRDNGILGVQGSKKVENSLVRPIMTNFKH